MKAFVAIGALVALLALPGATAILSTSDVNVLLAPAGIEGLPVLHLADDGGIYQESNGVDGLQSAPVVDENGDEIPADTLIAGPSMLPSL